MPGASPHTGNNVPAGCLKCEVGLAYGTTFCETIPAIGGKAVHRETDDHNDNVYKHQPIGEVRASERRGEGEREGGRKGGKGGKGGEEREEGGGKGGKQGKEGGEEGREGRGNGREGEKEGRERRKGEERLRKKQK